MEYGFNSSLLLSYITFAYFGAALSYLCLLVFKKGWFGRIGTWITLITVVAHTGAIIWRWVESYQMGIGRPPFSNLYESLIFFAWTIAAIYSGDGTVVQKPGHGRVCHPPVFPVHGVRRTSAVRNPAAGPGPEIQLADRHVITCFLGYAGFALAAGLALMYVIKKWTQGSGVWGLFPDLHVLENLIYQNIVIGFLLLTAGIITGSIWAHQAWGSYWSWDPKETWSLITWFVYAGILHARMVRGWQGMRIAALALVGFGCVLFTYFGVNFLLTGLHSYATGKS